MLLFGMSIGIFVVCVVPCVVGTTCATDLCVVVVVHCLCMCLALCASLVFYWCFYCAVGVVWSYMFSSSLCWLCLLYLCCVGDRVQLFFVLYVNVFTCVCVFVVCV